jgi:Arc/MetJ-type ribon-helix-helix transcriptional regulator
MEKVKRNMVPYSVYLPLEQHAKLRELAKEGKASSMIRDAISILLDNGDQYRAGYNQGLRDAVKVVSNLDGIKHIAYKGRYIDTMASEAIEGMEM